MTPRDPATLRLWLLQHRRAADYERTNGLSSSLMRRLAEGGVQLPFRDSGLWLATIERIESMRTAARSRDARR